MISNPYAVLVGFYETVGMHDFARELTPRLIDYLQQQDWVGRHVLDLGCGTGASIRWLANRGYTTTGVDSSREMVEAARRSLATSGLSLTWEQLDIRALDSRVAAVDLAIALDVLNELASLRDLEHTFAAVLQVLEPGKVFAFDMHTIQGLSERGQTTDRITYDDGALTLVESQDYDHDRQILHVRYRVFQREGEMWRRTETRRTLRGYPVQAILTLLQRTGYDVLQPIRLNFEPLDSGVVSAERVLFLARRPDGR
jgi:predicted TPR repeat methyltransferase